MYNSSREKVSNLFFLELMQKTDILQQVKDVKETFIAAHSHALRASGKSNHFLWLSTLIFIIKSLLLSGYFFQD